MKKSFHVPLTLSDGKYINSPVVISDPNFGCITIEKITVITPNVQQFLKCVYFFIYIGNRNPKGKIVRSKTPDYRDTLLNALKMKFEPLCFDYVEVRLEKIKDEDCEFEVVPSIIVQVDCLYF
jgi:hypothetical protein